MKIDVEYVGDELAASIIRVDEAVQRLNKSGIKQRLLITLIKDTNPTLRKDDIEQVLNCLSRLRKTYLQDVK